MFFFFFVPLKVKVCIALACCVSSQLVLSFSAQADSEPSEIHRWFENVAAGRSWKNLLISQASESILPAFCLLFSPWFSLLLGRGFTLELKRVVLCSRVCLVLVPFACGEALFIVQVLRVYPNVQDLGVSARLSESVKSKRK